VVLADRIESVLDRQPRLVQATSPLCASNPALAAMELRLMRRVAVVAPPRFLGRNRLIRHPHLRLVVDDSLAIRSSAYVNRDQAVVLKCWAEFEGQVVE